MKLALVIPALNEQEAIASTLRCALAARQEVINLTAVSHMSIVFVNDGSTDDTQAIVDQPEFDDVVKVRFDHNRGYGAAIKAGWQATDAELLGFMDADGTCNPRFCVNLLNQLCQRDVDVVLAARLNSQSKMPLVRKIGNFFFARLLGWISGDLLTDAASGFRIVRREALPLMSPLPNGLHFTPAMSCICLLDPRLRIAEVPMPYEKRIGRSKLSVIKDGLRFLYTILFSACCYAPIKTIVASSWIVALLAMGFSWGAWAVGGDVVALFGLVTAMAMIFMMVGASLICHQLNSLLIGTPAPNNVAERTLQRVLDCKRLVVIGTVGLVGGGWAMAVLSLSVSFVSPAILYVLLIGSSLLMICSAAMLLGGVVMRVIWAVGEKQKAMICDRYPARSTNVFSGPIGGQSGSAEVLHQAKGDVDKENWNIQGGEVIQSKL